MENKTSSLKYYSFAFSNFLAALGGGMILGKAVSILDIPFLKNGSIMAFFIGTLLGLLFLKSIPEKLSTLFSKWFAISGGFSSLILLGIYKKYSVQGILMNKTAIFFFFFLSIRFGLWFYSRVLRVSSVAGHEQQIGLVELGYYSGMILGLVIWKLSGLNITLITALFIDCILQLSAGIIDLYSYKKSVIQCNSQKKNLINQNYDIHKKYSSWELPCTVILATISTQVIIFSLTHYVSVYFSSYMLATFYFGALMGSIIFKKFNFNLTTEYPNCNLKYIMSFSTNTGIKRKISFLFIGLLIASFVSITILDLHYGLRNNIREILLLICIFCSAFLYEILALSILDRIGLEDNFLTQKNSVIRTYALMGICAALIFWIIGFTNFSLVGLFFILSACIISSTWIMQYREH